MKKNLLTACSEGDYEYLADFVSKNPLKGKYDVFDNHHWGPLHHAVVSNSLDCVRALLSVKGFHSGTITFEGCSALFLGIKRKVSAEVIQLLVDKCPKLINLPNNEDVYPIHVAVEHDQLDAVKVLIETLKRKNMPIIDHMDLDRETSLMLAARNKNLEVITYLLQNTDFDCKCVSAHNLNAFTITAMYKDPMGNEDDTVAILELLLPLTYDYDASLQIMPPEMLFPVSFSWCFQNYEIVDWFVEKFYLCDGNLERPLVQRLLDEFKNDPMDYGFYNILFALNSNISNAILDVPVDDAVKILLWSKVYSHFYEIFIGNRHLFEAIIPVFLPKFQKVQPKVVRATFFTFFVGFVKFFDDNVTPVRKVPDYDYNQSTCLEFLHRFPIHTNIDIKTILKSDSMMTYFTTLPEEVKNKFLNELFALLLPFSTDLYEDDVVAEVLDTIPEYVVNRHGRPRVLGDTMRVTIANFLRNRRKPNKLFDLCRATVRQCVFNQGGSSQEKLNRLMLLDVPPKIKNLLRFNETSFIIRN